MESNVYKSDKKNGENIDFLLSKDCENVCLPTKDYIFPHQDVNPQHLDDDNVGVEFCDDVEVSACDHKSTGSIRTDESSQLSFGGDSHVIDLDINPQHAEEVHAEVAISGDGELPVTAEKSTWVIKTNENPSYALFSDLHSSAHNVHNDTVKCFEKTKHNQNIITTKPAENNSGLVSYNRNELNQIETTDITIITPHSSAISITNLSVDTAIYDIKMILASDTKTTYNIFSLMFDGKIPKDGVLLRQLMKFKRNQLEFDMEFRVEEDKEPRIKLGGRDLKIDDEDDYKLHVKRHVTSKCRPGKEDLLEVHTYKPGLGVVITNVWITWASRDFNKPYLGGYKNLRNGIVYHNAQIQTIIPPKPPSLVKLYTRQSQTYKLRHFGQTTLNTTSTQMTKPGYYVSNLTDKLVIPGPYETADEYHLRILKHIIVLQKNVRRWLAKQRVTQIRLQRDACRAFEEAAAAADRLERSKRLQRDLDRRLNPKSRSDFDRLYAALEQWRCEETARINAVSSSEAERKAALALLLDQQVDLIAAISRHQIAASAAGCERAQVNLLRRAAATKRWTAADDGRPIEMDTPHTLRGRELLEIYEALRLNCLTQDERLDVLLTLKNTVKEHACSLTREIAELVDREADFIMRGAKNTQLDGLRLRILHRFVLYVKTPAFNPEIAGHLLVPTGTVEGAGKLLRGDVMYCNACNQYMRSGMFPLAARSTNLAPCKSCRRQDNRARLRRDLAPYRRILAELRRYEVREVMKARAVAAATARTDAMQRFQDGRIDNLAEEQARISSEEAATPFSCQLATIINAEDMRSLVDDIWERRSVFSSWPDLADLVFTRWRRHEPWAPWNTILVTREEAKNHNSLGGISNEAAYGDALIHRINQCLVIARNAFGRLARLGRQLSGRRAPRVDATEREPLPLAAYRLTTRPLEEPGSLPAPDVGVDPASLEARQLRRLPLDPERGNPLHLLSSADSHAPTWQPAATLLPAIRGEGRPTRLTAETNHSE